jgi:hypothetical protein
VRAPRRDDPASQVGGTRALTPPLPLRWARGSSHGASQRRDPLSSKHMFGADCIESDEGTRLVARALVKRNSIVAESGLVAAAAAATLSLGRALDRKTAAHQAIAEVDLCAFEVRGGVRIHNEANA